MNYKGINSICLWFPPVSSLAQNPGFPLSEEASEEAFYIYEIGKNHQLLHQISFKRKSLLHYFSLSALFFAIYLLPSFFHISNFCARLPIHGNKSTGCEFQLRGQHLPFRPQSLKHLWKSCIGGVKSADAHLLETKMKVKWAGRQHQSDRGAESSCIWAPDKGWKTTSCCSACSVWQLLAVS